MRPNAVLETCLYVDDLDAAERFYSTVLGLDLYAKVEGRHVFFRCGDGMLLLFDPETTNQPGLPFPLHGARGPGHTAFVMEEGEIDSWRGNLASHSVPVELELTWPNGGVSIYFRDPAGNSVELATRTLWAADSAQASPSP